MRKLINDAKVYKNENGIIFFETPEKEFSVLWFADAHMDNPKSELGFMHKTIKDNQNSYIIFGGDNHDLMQWKMDKRASYSAIKEEHKGDDYFNRVIHTTQKEIIEPYKDRIICFTRGNHETSITRKLNFDFFDFLLQGSNINCGDFSGYINFRTKIDDKRQNSKLLYYQHAPSTGGKRSKGMLSVDIMLGQRPSADIILSEHIHTTTIHPETVEVVNRNFSLKEKLIWFIFAPTLKAEHKGRREGFYHEKVKAGTTTIGAIKLNFKYNKDNNLMYVKPEYELMYN